MVRGWTTVNIRHPMVYISVIILQKAKSLGWLKIKMF